MAGIGLIGTTSAEEINYDYVVPYAYGQDTNGGCSGFVSRIYGFALEDNVNIQIDSNRDGNIDYQTTLASISDDFNYVLNNNRGAIISSSGQISLFYKNGGNNCGSYDDSTLAYSIYPTSIAKGKDFYVPTYGTAYISSVAGNSNIYLNGALVSPNSAVYSTSVVAGDKISSDSDIVIAIANRGSYITRTWAYQLLPVGSLGTDYYLPTSYIWETTADGADYSVLNVVATQDNTDVYYDNNGDGISDYSATLNEGQVESIPTTSGIHIYSSNPVAVGFVSESYERDAWGSRYIYYSYAYSVAPLSLIQKEFIVTGGSSYNSQHRSGHKFFVVAAEDATVVTVDNDRDGNADLTYNLDASDTSEISVSYKARLSSNKPIQIVRISAGGWYGAGVDATYEAINVLGKLGLKEVYNGNFEIIDPLDSNKPDGWTLELGGRSYPPYPIWAGLATNHYYSGSQSIHFRLDGYSNQVSYGIIKSPLINTVKGNLNWVQSQLTTFDPSDIEYTIKFYDENGVLVSENLYYTDTTTSIGVPNCASLQSDSDMNAPAIGDGGPSLGDSWYKFSQEIPDIATDKFRFEIRINQWEAPNKVGDGDSCGSQYYGEFDNFFIEAIPINPPNSPPVASFDVLSSQPIITNIITLDASSSVDPDGGNIVKYNWEISPRIDNFGLAHLDELATVDNVGIDSLNFWPRRTGIYTIQLTIEDDEGQTSSISKQIDVKPLDGYDGTQYITQTLSSIYVLEPTTFNANIQFNLYSESNIEYSTYSGNADSAKLTQVIRNVDGDKATLSFIRDELLNKIIFLIPPYISLPFSLAEFLHEYVDGDLYDVALVESGINYDDFFPVKSGTSSLIIYTGTIIDQYSYNVLTDIVITDSYLSGDFEINWNDVNPTLALIDEELPIHYNDGRYEKDLFDGIKFKYEPFIKKSNPLKSSVKTFYLEGAEKSNRYLPYAKSINNYLLNNGYTDSYPISYTPGIILSPCSFSGSKTVMVGFDANCGWKWIENTIYENSDFKIIHYHKKGKILPSSDIISIIPKKDIQKSNAMEDAVQYLIDNSDNIFKYQFGILESPANLHAMDQYGRHVGINEITGEIDLQIPEAYYSGPDAHPQWIAIYNESLEITLYTTGIEEGTFNLIREMNGFENAEIYSFQNIPTTYSTKAYLYESNLNMLNVDFDGDGIFEINFYSPISEFSVAPSNPIVRQVITFDAALSSNSDIKTVTYNWDFGNGNTANEPIAHYFYNSSGSYFITLTVIGEDGTKSSKTKVITVEAPSDETTPNLVANMNVNPDILNIKSGGKYITTYTEIPGYDVHNINLATVYLVSPSGNAEPVKIGAPATVGDYDGDGEPDLMVKFSRTNMVSYLDKTDASGSGTKINKQVDLIITGELENGTPFEGTDTIRVIKK